jgi:hypothetical protein
MLAPPGNLRQIPINEIAALQNKVVRIIGNFPRQTSVRELLKALKIPYIYYYIAELCRQQAEVIQIHKTANVHNIGEGKARHKI